jgi:hypothetical protein
MKAANWLSSVPHLRPLQRFLMNPPAEVARFATEKCGNLSGHSDIMVSPWPRGALPGYADAFGHGQHCSRANLLCPTTQSLVSIENMGTLSGMGTLMGHRSEIHSMPTRTTNWSIARGEFTS